MKCPLVHCFDDGLGSLKRFAAWYQSADPGKRREAMMYARERVMPVAGGHMRELQVMTLPSGVATATTGEGDQR